MFCLKNVLQAASLNQYLQQRQCHARFHSKNKEPNKPCDKRFGETGNMGSWANPLPCDGRPAVISLTGSNRMKQDATGYTRMQQDLRGCNRI